MPRPPHRPEHLVGVPFLARQAIDRGDLTPGMLRSPGWTRLFRGVYVTSEHVRDSSVRLRALRLATRQDPSAIVSGLSAAWVLGAWDPPPQATVPLQVTRGLSAPGTGLAGVRRRRGLLGSSWDVRTPNCGWTELDDDVVEIDGLTLTSPLRTCFDLARATSLVEAVAVADAFAHRTGMPLELFDAYCARHRGWRGIRTARAAARLAHAGARSPGESRLRMVVVLSGYDEPLVNVPVVDPRTGRVVGVPDLTVVARDVVLAGLEYDGGYHDEEDQPHRDRGRQNTLVSRAVPLLRYDALCLAHARDAIVDDLARLTGRPPLYPLDPEDFARRRLA